MQLATLISAANIYMDKPYIKVGFNRKDRILFNIWNGFASHEEVLEIGQRTIDAAIFEKANKVLFDSRHMEVLDEASHRYISQEFTQEMLKVGVLYAATVLPEDIFAKQSIKQIKHYQEDAGMGHAHYFKSLQKAFDWLKSK